MSSVVEKLAAAGELTPEQVERIGRHVQEMVKAAKENPELLKEAGFMGSVGRVLMDKILPPIVAGGALMGGAAGANRLMQVMEDRKNESEKAGLYQEMMEANPQLKSRDATAVQRAFNTLHRFNPEFARDPMVAGSFVDAASEVERVDVNQVKNLVDARRSMADVRKGGPITATGLLGAAETGLKMHRLGEQTADTLGVPKV
jgi:hypothetical protein